MEGILFLTNSTDRKIAVQIDLTRHGELWEYLYDAVVAKQRVEEPHTSLSDVKKRLEP